MTLVAWLPIAAILWLDFNPDFGPAPAIAAFSVAIGARA